LGLEKFSVPLSEVSEVVATTKIAPVPSMPQEFLGLINLRGRIVGVIDLRSKFGVTKSSATAPQQKTCILISESGSNCLGFAVDEVIEVSVFEASQVETRETSQNLPHREFVNGVIKSSPEDLLLLINLSELVGSCAQKFTQAGDSTAA